MAANTMTSSTGVVTGTDAAFVLTTPINNWQGTILYLKYVKGTGASVTLTFDFINKSLHATDKYRMTDLTGTTLTALTMVITTAGNYRIPIPNIDGEKTSVINVTFDTAGTTGSVVANLMES